MGLHAEALRLAGVDTVVLGCTHYAFVRHHLQAALGDGIVRGPVGDAVSALVNLG